MPVDPQSLAADAAASALVSLGAWLVIGKYLDSVYPRKEFVVQALRHLESSIAELKECQNDLEKSQQEQHRDNQVSQERTRDVVTQLSNKLQDQYALIIEKLGGKEDRGGRPITKR